MADKGINFSDIKIIEDGINFLFKKNNEELLSINKISGLVTIPGQLNVKPTIGVSEDFYVEGSARIGELTIREEGDDIIFEGNNNSILRYSKIAKNIINNIEFDSTIKTNKSITKEIEVPTSGSKPIAGEARLQSPGANCYVTVNTTAVTSNSIILLTAKEQLYGKLWYDNIIDGTSFNINSDDIGDDNKKVAWLLINPSVQKRF